MSLEASYPQAERLKAISFADARIYTS